MTDLDPNDIEIRVYKFGTTAIVGVRVTHLPTGISASASGKSESRTTKAAMAELRVSVLKGQDRD